MAECHQIDHSASLTELQVPTPTDEVRRVGNGSCQSKTALQPRLMTAPVIAPAASKAKYTAVPATARRRGRHPSKVSFAPGRRRHPIGRPSLPSKRSRRVEIWKAPEGAVMVTGWSKSLKVTVRVADCRAPSVEFTSTESSTS